MASSPDSSLQLELTITSAKSLKNVNWRSGDLRAFTVAWVDPDYRLSTKIAESGNTDPRWEEKLILPLPRPVEDAVVTFEVYHDKSSNISKPFVGTATLRLREVLDAGGFDEKKLNLRRPSGRPQGRIKIAARLRDKGWPQQTPYPSAPVPAPGYGQSCYPSTGQSRDWQGYSYSQYGGASTAAGGYPPSTPGYPSASPGYAPTPPAYAPAAASPYPASTCFPTTAGYSAASPYPASTSTPSYSPTPYAAPQSSSYYGQPAARTSTTEPAKKGNKFGGMGAGLAVGALAGAVGGLALGGLANEVKDHYEDKGREEEREREHEEEKEATGASANWRDDEEEDTGASANWRDDEEDIFGPMASWRVDAIDAPQNWEEDFFY